MAKRWPDEQEADTRRSTGDNLVQVSLPKQATPMSRPSRRPGTDLAVRPICHETEGRIEAHIFVAFLAYCLQVTLKARLRTLAGGTTPRDVIDKFKARPMADVLAADHRRARADAVQVHAARARAAHAAGAGLVVKAFGGPASVDQALKRWCRGPVEKDGPGLRPPLFFMPANGSV